MAAGEHVSPGDLCSILESEVLCDVFLDNIDKIFSYTKVDIAGCLKKRKPEEIHNLREYLITHLCYMFEPDDFTALGVDVNREDPVSNLRKRNKPETCLDDIFVIGQSIVEKSLCKDILKCLQQKKSYSTRSISTPGSQSTFVSSQDVVLVNTLHEILGVVNDLKKENQFLKSSLQQMQSRLLHVEKLSSDNNKLLHNISNHAQNDSTSTNYSLNISDDSASSAPLPSTVTEINNLPPNEAERNISFNIQNDALSDLRNVKTSYAKIVQKPPPPPSSQSQSNNLIRAKAVKQSPPDSNKRGRKPIFGTRKQHGTKSIAGTPKVREFHVFVGGVHQSVTVDELWVHFENELKIRPIQIEGIKRNKTNQSFKVTIRNTDKHIVMNAENWEENICVLPFRYPRQSNPLPNENVRSNENESPDWY